MQPLHQPGPVVELRCVPLGDPHEASLLAQGLDMGTQKHSDTVGVRYSGVGVNYIAFPPAGTRRRFWASETLKNPRSHFVVVRYFRFGWVSGLSGFGRFPAFRIAVLAVARSNVPCRWSVA